MGGSGRKSIKHWATEGHSLSPSGGCARYTLDHKAVRLKFPHLLQENCLHFQPLLYLGQAHEKDQQPQEG